MVDDINSENEYLKDLAPNLFDRKVDSVSAPPGNYFEGLEKRIRDNSKFNVPPRKPFMRSKRSKPLLRLSLAASIALVIGLSAYWIWNNLNSANLSSDKRVDIDQFDPENITNEAIQAYLLDGSESFDLENADLLAELPDVNYSDDVLIDFLLEPTLFYEDPLNQLYED